MQKKKIIYYNNWIKIVCIKNKNYNMFGKMLALMHFLNFL